MELRPSGPVEVPRSAIILRFAPSAPERVIDYLEGQNDKYGHSEYFDQPYYRLSVFVTELHRGEPRADAIGRLLRTAGGPGGIRLRNNPYFFSGDAADLIDHEFTFHKDGYDGEIEEHYSVDLGLGELEPFEVEAARGPVERFLSGFPRRGRTADVYDGDS